MRGRMIGFVGALLLVALPSGAKATAPVPHEILRQPVSFLVNNPADPSHGPFTIRGVLVRPTGCTMRSVLLALHGLSYGAWAWDFPYQPERYSVAQSLAERGYAVLAIDELGYGASAGAGMDDHPNGYTLSVEAYADMTAQIIRTIRSGSYDGPAFSHVGLLGHSAGSEIAELTAGLYPDLVDALIATAYTHLPFLNNDWLAREWTQDNMRAAQSDYEYFETDPVTRAHDMYYLENADQNVVDIDTSLAALTPSGEIFSIGSQPSRWILPSITRPVLLVLADHDELFPSSNGENEMRLFASASDKTLITVPDSGHAFMLQQNASSTNERIAGWLQDHGVALPAC